MQAYRDKGRVSPILDSVPLLAVMTEDLGVRGAIKSAQMEYEKYKARKEGIVRSKSTVAEENAEFYKFSAQVFLAFSVGVICGITALKKP